MPSTAIRRYAYRPVDRSLDIEFITGRVYRYFGVPEQVAAGFGRYRSKGAYFNRALRDRFAFERLIAWEEELGRDPSTHLGATSHPSDARPETRPPSVDYTLGSGENRAIFAPRRTLMNEGEQNRANGQQQQSTQGGQQNDQEENVSGGQGYGGQQPPEQEDTDSTASMSEESLRSDQASQEEWGGDADDQEIGAVKSPQRSQEDFGTNGE